MCMPPKKPFNNNNNNNNNNNSKWIIETTGKWFTQMPKPVCEEGDVTVLWNQAVHTEKLQQIGQI